MASFSMCMTPELKEQMEEFYRDLGLSLETAVTIFFEQCIIQARMPFDISKAISPSEGFEPVHPDGKKTALFSVRLDAYKKAQAEYTFKECGLTASQAVSLYFKACLREYGIPFRVGYPIPNEGTLRALQESEDMDAGKIPSKTYDSVEEMVADILSDHDRGEEG